MNKDWCFQFLCNCATEIGDVSFHVIFDAMFMFGKVVENETIGFTRKNIGYLVSCFLLSLRINERRIIYSDDLKYIVRMVLNLMGLCRDDESHIVECAFESEEKVFSLLDVESLMDLPTELREELSKTNDKRSDLIYYKIIRAYTKCVVGKIVPAKSATLYNRMVNHTVDCAMWLKSCHDLRMID